MLSSQAQLVDGAFKACVLHGAALPAAQVKRARPQPTGLCCSWLLSAGLMQLSTLLGAKLWGRVWSFRCCTTRTMWLAQST